MSIHHRRFYLIIGVLIALLSIGHPLVGAQQGQAGTTLTTTVTAEGQGSGSAASWTIEKTVTPSNWDLFQGDTGTSEYTIRVTKTGGSGSGDALVRGEICVANEGERATENLALTALVQYKDGSGQYQDLTSAPVNVGSAPVLEAGQSACYPYEVGFTPVDGASYRVVSLVTITNHSGYLGEPFGPDTKADFSVSGSGGSGPNQITVVDSNGLSWSFDNNAEVTYSKTFACESGEGSYTSENVATIQETGQSASALVTVNCHALAIEKTVNPASDGTSEWTITKSVVPDSWTLFQGDSGVSQYTITVTKLSAGGSAWTIDGSVWVHNPTPLNAMLLNVADVLYPDNLYLDLNCGVAFPYELPAGQSLECTYWASLPDGTSRTNTAIATLQNYAYDYTGAVSQIGATDIQTDVPFSFDTAGGSVTVVDSNGQSWVVEDSTTISYDQTFTCEAPGWSEYPNVATIEGSEQTAEASVYVDCFDLTIEKEASTTISPSYDWTITKSADQTALTLPVGQSTVVNYEVVVDAQPRITGTIDGIIWVYNFSPIDATLNSVTDLMVPGDALVVDCGVTFPYVLYSQQNLGCSYTGTLPDATSGYNTATATLQNFVYDYLGGMTPSDTTDFSTQVEVDYNGTFRTPEVGLCVDVTDTLAGSLGTICYDDLTMPATMSYSIPVGPYATCGEYTVENTASYTVQDTGATGSASWNVAVTVPCDGGGSSGCTLTIGYWKTHAGFGPQDDALTELLPIWLGTPDGANSVQVTTAAQAVDILRMKGDSSNGVTKLYAQLLAAKLNIASGASAAIDATITAADSFLAEYSAADWSELTADEKQMVLGWMTSVDQFNNGLAGPPHCEDAAAVDLVTPAMSQSQVVAIEAPEDSSAECVLPVDQQPVALCLSERYGVPYETVLSLHFCEHQGFGNIERLYAGDKPDLPCTSQGSSTDQPPQDKKPDKPEKTDKPDKKK